jgi:hypothetical protein
VKDLVVLAVPCLMLAMLFCCWRAVNLFGTWRAATATVRDSDYSERERQDDFWHFGFTIGTIRGWNWRDGENARLITDKVEFIDSDGEQRRATVERRVHRGWRPSGAYTLWYDPNDPARVTAFGVVLVGMFGLCMDLARL